MKKAAQTVKRAAELFDLSVEKLVLRVIASYALVNSAYIIFSDVSAVRVEYTGLFGVPLTLAGILLCVLLLCVVMVKRKTARADGAVMLCSVTLFFLCCAFENDSVYAFILDMLMEAAAVFYVFRGTGGFKSFSRKVNVTVCVSLFFAFSAYVGLMTVMRYECWYSPGFDFGIFAQMFENMAKTGLPVTTCERNELLSHFAVHISPIWYVLLPFYMIFRDPAFLNAAQAVVAGSAVIPLYLLCKKFGIPDFVTAMLETAFVLYPALGAGCFYDVHENCFIAPLLLWLLYFAEKKKPVGVYIFAALTLCVKEDAFVYLVFIGAYLLLRKNDGEKSASFFKSLRFTGLMIAAGALIVFFIEVALLDSFGEGAMFGRYDNYGEGSGSLADVIRAVVTSPAYVFSQSMDAEKLEFALWMFAPLAFIPLVSKDFANYILLAPFMLINLMPDYAYQHSLNYQYNFGTTALFFYLTVKNLASYDSPERPERQWIKRALAVFCACAAAVSFVSVIIPRSGYVATYAENKELYARMEKLTRQYVPADASVAASAFIVPHLAEHEQLYELFPGREPLTVAEYYVIDMRSPHYRASLAEYMSTGNYELVCSQADCLAVLRYTGAPQS